MIPGWTEKDTEDRVSAYLIRHAKGEPDEDIRNAMTLTHAQLRQLKKETTVREVQGLQDQKTPDIFVEYRRNQLRLVKRLEDLADEFKTGGQAGPQVAAIKAISDVYDRVIKTGQDMGVIEKAPERSHVSGAVVFSDMSNQALQRFIAAVVGQSAALMEKYGSQNIIEAEFGQEYYALPDGGSAGDKHNRSATSRVSGGKPRVDRQKAV